VALRVGVLPSPQVNRQGEGWWFECAQCKHRWWYSASSDCPRENTEENIEKLRQIMAEFDGSHGGDGSGGGLAYSKMTDSGDSTIRTKDNASSGEEHIGEGRERSLKPESPDATSQDQCAKEEETRRYDYQLSQILKDPRNREVLDGITGEKFFPKKPIIDSFVSSKQGRSPQLHVVKEEPTSKNYSYRRVLPQRRVSNNMRENRRDSFSLANEASFKMPSDDYTVPSFFNANSTPASPEGTNLNGNTAGNNSPTPIEKNQKFVEDIHIAKRKPGRRRFLMEFPKKGESMHREKGISDLNSNSVSNDLYENSDDSALTIDKPGYVKDPESVSDGVLTLWASSPQGAAHHEAGRNSKGRWAFFKRRPRAPIKKSDCSLWNEHEGDEVKLGSVKGSTVIPQSLEPKVLTPKMHIPGNAENTSCFAISEEGKSPVIIPFTKESSKSKVLPPLFPDYKETPSPSIKIPVITEEKEEPRKWKFGSGLKWFVCIVVGTTIAAAYFSYKHKSEVLNLWKSPTGPNIGIAAEQLSLERVSYSFAKDGVSSKITIVGEIVNNKDSTLNVSPLRVKIFSTKYSKLLTTWDYSPNMSAILPNEHSFFKIERVLPLDSNQEIQVEVSFTQARQQSHA
jgi:hypothetical protein